MQYLFTEGLVSVYRHKVKGFCLIASKNIHQGTFLFTNAVGTIGFDDLKKKSSFNDYPMYWGKKTDCIAFGLANLLNHAEESNVRLERDIKRRLISAFALRRILKGEEFTIHYHCKLWFNPMKPEKVSSGRSIFSVSDRS